MTLVDALGGWVSAHPWMTFFVLWSAAGAPGRFVKAGVKFNRSRVKR